MLFHDCRGNKHLENKKHLENEIYTITMISGDSDENGSDRYG